MAKTYKVQSESNPDKVYVITVTDNDEWRCTCPHYTHRFVNCKHIRQKQDEQANSQTKTYLRSKNQIGGKTWLETKAKPNS